MPIKRGSPEYWNMLPDWVKYTAIDGNGNDYAFAFEPEINCNVWDSVFAKKLIHNKNYDIPAIVRDNISWDLSLLTRPYTWKQPDKNTPIDTKVYVLFSASAACYYHFAGMKDDGIGVFTNGCTSWTSNGIRVITPGACAFVVIADPDNLGRKPTYDECKQQFG